MSLVTVVGSFVQDLAFISNGLPQPGETRTGRFFQGPGGKGSNQAFACQRQDIATTFIGAVGNDLFAESFRSFARQNNLQFELQILENQNTGAASIVVDKSSAQNQIVVALGANAFLTAQFVESKISSNSKIILTQLESNLLAGKKALQIGKSLSAINILNPAPIDPIAESAQTVRELLDLSDIITPNESEFLNLQKYLLNNNLHNRYWETLSDSELHKLCLKLAAKTTIITLGKEGCFLATKDKFRRYPIFDVKAIDTTGAGDAFSGGLAAGLIKFEADIDKAIQYASAVAALSTTKQGTAPSMPYSAEVLNLLDQYRPS